MQYNACALGAGDAQRDKLAIAMQQAYFTAYWNNAKHPKTLDRVIRSIYKDDTKPKPNVDVEKFLSRKRRFEENGGFATNKNCIIPAAR